MKRNFDEVDFNGELINDLSGKPVHTISSELIKANPKMNRMYKKYKFWRRVSTLFVVFAFASNIILSIVFQPQEMVETIVYALMFVFCGLSVLSIFMWNSTKGKLEGMLLKELGISSEVVYPDRCKQVREEKYDSAINNFVNKYCGIET